VTVSGTDTGFRHEALFYAGRDEFLEGTVPFLEEGILADEPTLVVVAEQKIGWLRSELDALAKRVVFADMNTVGANPARIIPAWNDFVSQHDGRALRGIGEPIWAGRSSDELVECQLHEALLNLAFRDAAEFQLLCPYDTSKLESGVIEEAWRSHPHGREGALRRPSPSYREPSWTDGPFVHALAAPAGARELPLLGLGDLDRVRALVYDEARAFGLTQARTTDLVLAVHEAAVNSLTHGGRPGRLRIWPEGDALVCEISGGGVIEEPLLGRVRPSLEQERGRGIWLIQQVADLAQFRSDETGTTVRIRVVAT
jgi:anti-sigma regulatory factor (Ser/Thr protein kinase)